LELFKGSDGMEEKKVYKIKWPLYTARSVSLLWGGWWTFFGIASGIGEGLPVVGVFVHAAVPGLIFLFTALIAWAWELVGGFLLIAESLAVFIGYPFLFRGFSVGVMLLAMALLGLPPLISGILFLISWRLKKAR
jgi:hypothetical protein